MTYHLTALLVDYGVAILRRQTRRERLRVHNCFRKHVFASTAMVVISLSVMVITQSNLWLGAASMASPVEALTSMSSSVLLIAMLACGLGFLAQVVFCTFLRLTCRTTIFPRVAIVMGSILGYAALLIGIAALIQGVKSQVTSDLLAAALAGMVMAGHMLIVAWAFAIAISSAHDVRDIWRHFFPANRHAQSSETRRIAYEAALRLSRTTTVLLIAAAAQAVVHHHNPSEIKHLLAFVLSLAVCRAVGYRAEADAVWGFMLAQLRAMRQAISPIGKVRKGLSHDAGDANDGDSR